MYQPTTTSSAESRNGTRQPQARNSASVWTAAMIASTPAASRLPAGDAGLRPARPEAAPRGVAMLGRHQHRAAPFAADGEALDQAQDDQRDRRPDADLRIGRQKADQHGGDAHQDQAQHQQSLAADAVAEMAEDDAADRPRDEAERIGREGQQRPGQRVESGKNSLLKTSAAAEP